MTHELVVLRGGSRNGESTEVDHGVRRLITTSDAPGLLDVYEATGQSQELSGNAELALVFTHIGQEAAQ